MPLNIALFASGRGSNVKAILHAIEQKMLDAHIQCVICNIDNAPVIDLARAAGVPTFVLPHKGISREGHEAQILEVLSGFEIDYLVLAGYLRLMTPAFLGHFKTTDHYRVINIHPSLLPAFPGTQAYRDAYEYGVKYSGVTIHFVDEGLDSGPIVLQEPFPRLDTDTLDTFTQRGLALEHLLYPKALQLLAEKKVCFRYDTNIKRYYIEIKSHVTC